VPPHLVTSVATGRHIVASEPGAVTVSWVCTRAVSQTWAGPGVISSLGWANSVGFMGRSWRSTVRRFFRVSIFVYIFRKSYKFQKSIENTIKLRKIYNKYKKSEKIIFAHYYFL
jgi:hypothetical protein